MPRGMTNFTKIVQPGITLSATDVDLIFELTLNYVNTFTSPLSASLNEHLKLYHYPRIRIASGEINVFHSSEEIKNIWGNMAVQNDKMPGSWDHSELVQAWLVQADEVKAHIIYYFRRLDADDNLLLLEQSLIIAEKFDGKWLVTGTSSFAK